jgi:protein-tyrosine phosphatase
VVDTGVGQGEERAPMRQLVLQNPEDYQGSRNRVDGQGVEQHDQAFIVNGSINIECGSYIFHFQPQQIFDEDICFGSYPDGQADIRLIKKLKCITVMNLSSKEELMSRRQSDEALKKLCRQQEVNYVPFPISDESIEEMADNMFQACLILDDIINNQGHKVYVQCLTGVTKSPTLILLFLCLYKYQNTGKSIPSLDHLKSMSASLFDQLGTQTNQTFKAHGDQPTALALPNYEAILHALRKEKAFYLNSQR